MAKSFVFNPLSGNFDIISEVTIGTANGLSITAAQALSLGLSSTSTTGALSNTDWNTFNGKQAAGNYITALTGDATATGPGSVALTLATVNSNVGSFGTASNVGAFTVNAKGLITAATSTAIQIAESQVTNLVTDLAAKQSTTLTNTHILVGNVSNVATDVAASGDLTLANTGAFTIATSAVTNAKMADMAQATIKGRASGAGTGAPVDLTATQATAILNTFTSGLQGLVPASGGGTTNFLRADGTFAVPVDTGITQLTGDVTAGPGNGSQAATIANNAVTNAKAAQMATLTIKGNNTGGSSNPLDLTVAQVKTMLSLTGTNSGDVTLAAVGASPNANAATLSGQVLNLEKFSSTQPGVVSASGGGTTNFLRADGTWAAAGGSGTITNWASYTPTYQGFGTVTNTYCRWRQVGQNYEVEAKIVMGTVTASAAQMSLPNSGVVSSAIASIGLFGYWTSASASGTAQTIIANGGNAFVNFGFSAGASAGLDIKNGSDMISTGGTISFYYSVPIQGL